MGDAMQFDENAMKAILKGADLLAAITRRTIGPSGSYVAIKQKRAPLFTKDGATIIRAVTFDDQFTEMGGQLIKEAATKTRARAGDGAKRSILVAHALFKEGAEHILAGAHPMSIKRGVEKSLVAALEALQRLATPHTSRPSIEQLATEIAGDATVGAHIAEAIGAVGHDGLIELVVGTHTELVFEEGSKWESGYLSPYFITHPKQMEAKLEKGAILTLATPLTRDLMPPDLLEQLYESSSPLCIIAPEVEANALSELVSVALGVPLSLCIVAAPGYGERQLAILHDIATLTGGRPTYERASFDDLGHAEHITISPTELRIQGGKGDPHRITRRIKDVQGELERAPSEYDASNMRARLTTLRAASAHITLPENLYKRSEAALTAARSAAASGTLAGGGRALADVARLIEDLPLRGEEALGRKSLQKALHAPSDALGFRSHPEPPPPEPLYIVETLLRQGVSIASLLLTVSCMVSDTPHLKPAPPEA